jgi:phospholipid-binding lipoprotein MlaA
MKRFFITLLLSALIAFQASAGTDEENSLSKKNSGNVSGNVKECFEGLNRSVFAFNQGLDKIIFKPVSKAYLKLPNSVRRGTGNAVTNLSNVLTIPNNLLQGNFLRAGENTARLLINTTVGVLGIFDVASSLGFSKYAKEDYGQTLGSWGIGEGCYVVLPVLGPSTARDAFVSFGSLNTGLDPWYNITAGKDTHHFNDFDYYSSRGVNALDFRAKNIDSFNNLEKNSMDFYASVKSLYLQDRRRKINNSNKITETLDDSGWEELGN